MSRSMTRAAGAVAVGLALCVGSGAAEAGQTPEARIGWVGLFNDELIGGLENENRIDEICPDRSVERLAAWERCRRAALAPKTLVLRLRAAPTPDAAGAGDLLVTAFSGRGLHATYVPPGGGTGVPVDIDMFDPDWGYGPPYFHLTVVEQRANWVRLTVGPFSSGSWMDVSALRSDPFLWIEPGMIVTSTSASFVVLEVTAGALLVREEQDADMWCEPGPPPPLVTVEPRRLTGPDLFTNDGRLRLRVKYTRGC